jgi:hypothetical protein
MIEELQFGIKIKEVGGRIGLDLQISNIPNSKALTLFFDVFLSWQQLKIVIFSV